MLREEEIIKGCIKGDRSQQRALYEAYCQKMMAIAKRYTKTTEEAEDVLQEAFVKVFASIGSFRNDSKLNTWITRIVINTALNAQRSKLYLLPMVDIENTNLHENESVSLAGFELAELISMIQSLPDGCRMVFNLFAIEGYSHKEIGEMLGVNEGTSKSQYNRAKELLRLKLKNHEEKYGKFGKVNV